MYYPIKDDVEDLVEHFFQDATPKYTNLASFDYNKYHRFDDYQSWQSDFAEKNSDLIEFIDYGTSFEVILTFTSTGSLTRALKRFPERFFRVNMDLINIEGSKIKYNENRKRLEKNNHERRNSCSRMDRAYNNG